MSKNKTRLYLATVTLLALATVIECAHGCNRIASQPANYWQPSNDLAEEADGITLPPTKRQEGAQ